MAVIDRQKCNGCKTCYSICPVLAIKMENKVATIVADKCLGCSNCEQRCPRYAVLMVTRNQSLVIGIDTAQFDGDQIHELCAKAKFHPEQVICFCTGTRAGEIAAAIIAGPRHLKTLLQ